MLKLKGHFSYIDKYNKLKFIWTEDDSKDKLVRQCVDGIKPFDDEGFTVVLSKSLKTVPSDISAKVGLKCTIFVRLNKYNFISKLGKNKGEKIVGCQLILNDISTD